jgi:U2-associated protein SR140
LLVDGTPVPRKVSRLHLICDILHNSAVPLPGAWRFRQEFQSRLGIVFDHLSSIYHSFPGRITADTFKGQIVAVLILWEDSLVFPAEFISELRERLEGAPLKQESTIAPAEQADAPHDAPATVAPRFKASSFKPATEVAQAIPVAVVAPEEDSEGEPMDEGTDDEADATPVTISAPIRDEVDGKLVNDDIDGVPLDDMDGEPVVDDLDGAPLDDIDGEPIDDIDGAPLDDVDGAPLDDDLDGEPMEDLDGTPVQM